MTNEEHEHLQKTYKILRQCKKRAKAIETYSLEIERLRLANSGVGGSGPNITGIRTQQVEFDNITYVHQISEMEKKIDEAAKENNKIISHVFEAVDDPIGVTILMQYYFRGNTTCDDVATNTETLKTSFEATKRNAVKSLATFYAKYFKKR